MRELVWIQELGRRNNTGIVERASRDTGVGRRNRTGMDERASRDTGVRTEK